MLFTKNGEEFVWRDGAWVEYPQWDEHEIINMAGTADGDESTPWGAGLTEPP